jgi:microcystin-dependent protein
MSFKSGLSQRTTLNGIFFNNSTSQTYANTETNTALIASLQYVKSFTDYFIYLTYILINNGTFEGTMTGENILLTGNLSAPTINEACNFTGDLTIKNQNVEYDILGEIKMVINLIPVNCLLCDGSSYSSVEYPDLFNIIGYEYGGSNGAFNVPNFESYFPIGGNFDNGAGNPVSNFAYGNNTTGAINTYKLSSNFAGNTEPVSSLMQVMPTHSHNINDPGHTPNSQITKNENVYIELDLLEPIYLPVAQTGTSGATAITKAGGSIQIQNSGDDIQATDPVSGLNGVNISPPYIAVKYTICFAQN